MTLLQPELPVRFDGSDYSPSRDDERLTGQLLRVWEVVKDGKKRTLAAIAEATGDPEASISAQLRHLRKARFGGHDVRKEHWGGGLYMYWIQK
jgi:hypothetical protein